MEERQAGGRTRFGRPLGVALAAAILIGIISIVRGPLGGSGVEDPATSAGFDPAFDLPGVLELAAIPRASRFSFPVGSEAGALVYNAQPFFTNRHLGDDWNGIGGENSDLGDPVYATGAGRVLFAGDSGGGWGKIVILAHRLDDGELLQTFYGHLDAIRVAVGTSVFRGQEIGTVGNVGGQYFAHLHFEVRDSLVIDPGTGYGDVALDRRRPSTLIDGTGAFAPWQLNPSPAPLAEVEGAVEMRFSGD